MFHVVLGMHKSGTTLVAQSLHASGVNMGFDIDAERFTYAGNQCESPTVNRINNLILRSENTNSLDIHAGLRLQQDATVREAIAEYLDRMGAYPDAGVKDPRLCFSYPVWRDLLPEHGLIVVFRDPYQVWRHYRGSGPRQVSRYFKAFRRYVECNRQLLAYLDRDRKPQLILEYHRLMTLEAEMARLEAFVGRTLQDVREPDMYRQRRRPGPWQVALHRTLLSGVAGIPYAQIHDQLVRRHAAQLAAD